MTVEMNGGNRIFSSTSIKKRRVGAAEMAQQLKAHVALVEDKGLIPSTIST